jgi:hypothetical protein
MAMINLLDKIIEALDEGRAAIGIFIDFSKAFDTVNHSILYMIEVVTGLHLY